MNDGLDKMNPSIPASEGWDQMQALLNQHLPATKQLHTKRRLLFAFAALFIGCMLLCSSLQLGSGSFFLNGDNTVIFQNINNGEGQAPVLVTNHTNKFDPAYSIEKPILNIGKKNIFARPFLQNNDDKISTSLSTENTQHVNGVIEKHVPIKTLSALSFVPLANNHFFDNEKEVTKLNLLKWNLSVGAGFNVTGNSFQPYPVAEARYNITNQFYVAAGAALYSPVNTTAGGINKTTYLNDASNNVYLEKERTVYSNLRYADIPVTAGVNISKHLSFQTGVQVSILMNKTTSLSNEYYDFQMDRISLPPTTSLLVSAINQQTNYDTQLKNVDYRLINTLQYHFKKTTAALSYQHGLQSVNKGNNAANNRNNLLSINILFKLK